MAAKQYLLCLILWCVHADDEHDIYEAKPSNYDCQNLGQTSPISAQEWCCRNKGIACTTTTSTSSNNDSNCTDMVNVSELQRQWCCLHEKSGCLNGSDSYTLVRVNGTNETNETLHLVTNVSTDATQPSYNCTNGTDVSSNWTSVHLLWCCQHQGFCGNVSNSGLVPFASSTLTPSDSNGSVINQSNSKTNDTSTVKVSDDAMDNGNVSGTNNSISKSPSLVNQKDGDYDCVEGASNWKLEWTNEKAIWCCKFRNVSCFDSIGTSSKPFDCSGAVEDWSGIKTQWCCESENLGCPSTTGPMSKPDRFNCEKKGHWSRIRQAWCCKNKNIGCYACSPKNVQIWDPAQRSWCCEHRNRGCFDADNEAPMQVFSCNLKDVDMWPSDERNWCCKNKNLGCDPECDLTTFPAWTKAQQIWCCKTRELGCPRDQTTSVLFDCYAEEIESWSPLKSQWCCSNMKRGCPRFDCEDGYSNWKLGFSEAKKTWCCERYGMACEPTSQPASHVSQAPESFEIPERSRCQGDPQEWPSAKMQWCCLVEHRGCLDDLNKELEQPYDCYQGRSNKWPPEKAAWCCFEKGTGCEIESFMQKQNPEQSAEEDDSAFYFVLLLLLVIVIISYYRAKGHGNGRRSFSFGPSPSQTTYGRGVYSALGSRYMPPSLP